WWRVLRHEIAMGLVLGVTLGVIGFARASFTPEGVRSSSPPRPEGFTVTTPADEPLVPVEEQKPKWLIGLFGYATETRVERPEKTRQEMTSDKKVIIELPENEGLPEPEKAGGQLVYHFPAKCTLRQPPVPRFQLAWVIALAVAAICL